MTKLVVAAVMAASLFDGCEGPAGVVNGLVTGTWGGDNAGLIADDTSAHVHIACTFGNVPGGITVTEGAFDLAGEYVLRAYPVAVGPSLPARFRGVVRGSVLTLTVIVNDTTAGEAVTLGPVKVHSGREPQMQMCPICRKPGERAP